VLRCARDAGWARASPWPDPDRQAEHGYEQQHREGGEPDREHGVLAQAHVVGGKAGADHHGDAGQHEADERQQNGEQRDRRPDQEQRTACDPRERLPAHEGCAHRHHGAVDHDQERERARHVARTHHGSAADRQVACEHERERPERDQEDAESDVRDVDA
jgi:hypothetical protein